MVRLTRPRAGTQSNGLILPLALLGLMVMASFVVPLISPYGVFEALAGDPLDPPSWRHLFGTDRSGFDMFVRVFYATRVDLTIAFVGVGLGAVFGVLFGLIGGQSRGWLARGAMSVADVLQAFPVFILALTLVAITGNDIRNVVWALAFVKAPIFFRLVRGEVLAVRELRYIEAADVLGLSRWRVLFRHLMPNSIGPAIVQFGVSLGYGIMTVAGLAFLGVGIQVPTPEWGSMIATGSGDIMRGSWWPMLFPGLTLAVCVFAFNLLSDGVGRRRSLL